MMYMSWYDFNLLPEWRLMTKPIYAQRNGSWQEARQIFVNNAGQWKQIWAGNFPGGIGEQHPFWRYNKNFDFVDVNDGTINPAAQSWTTYFSTNNAGFYTYPQSGQLRLSIGARDGNGFGDCYLDSKDALKVNPGQVYSNTVTVDAATSGTLMSLRAYSNINEVDAFKGGANRAPFETPLQQVAPGTTIQQSITIPAGHNWIRLYLYIQSNQALPRNYTFSRWRFTRTA